MQAAMTRRSLWIAAISVLVVALGGCSTAQVDRGDPSAFAAKGYRTYNWNYAQVEPLPSDTSAYTTMAPIFREEMNRALANLGYREVEQGGQFVVSLQFKRSLADGVVSIEKDPNPVVPRVVLNRDPDQASLDNAQALAGVRQLNNVLIQFDDASDGGLLWAAAVSRVQETANINELDPEQVRRNARQTLRRVMSQLPLAP